ncbi:hypothetical protein B0H14DRAFT_2623391 [Mycena olivaceomarginata]|nr:hypothetical protein B0H14DRAFT_2623391 [Mycena olivaceomarginata]
MDAEMRRGRGHHNVDGMGQEAWGVGAMADHDAQRPARNEAGGSGGDRNLGAVCVRIKREGRGREGMEAACGGGRCMRQHAGWREGGKREHGERKSQVDRERRAAHPTMTTERGKEKGRVGTLRMGVWEEWITRYSVRTGGLTIKAAGKAAQAAGRRCMRPMLTRRCCTIEAHGSRSGMGQVEGEEEGVKERDEEQGMGEKVVARAVDDKVASGVGSWLLVRHWTGAPLVVPSSLGLVESAPELRDGQRACACRADHGKGAGIEQAGSTVDEAGHRRRRRGAQDAQRWGDQVQRQSAGKVQCEGGQCRAATGKNDPYGGEMQRCVCMSVWQWVQGDGGVTRWGRDVTGMAWRARAACSGQGWRWHRGDEPAICPVLKSAKMG